MPWQQNRRRIETAGDGKAANSPPGGTSAQGLRGLPRDFPLNVVIGALWKGYGKNQVFEQCALAARVSLVNKEWAEQVKSWQNSSGESFEHAIGPV
jgi:hypothetical protein